MTFATSSAAEEDTYYWLTLRLASLCGFSVNEARLIATGNWAIDQNPTAAEVSVGQIQDFLLEHWPSPLAPEQEETLKAAIQQALGAQGIAIRTSSVVFPFGEYLHQALQEEGGSFAFGTSPGQVTALFDQSNQRFFHAFATGTTSITTQLLARQQALYAEFLALPPEQTATRLLALGKLLHFVQDKWAGPPLAAAGTTAASLGGEDAASSEDLDQRARYRRMAEETTLWFGEAAWQLGVPNPCSNGLGTPDVGPWKLQEFDAVFTQSSQLSEKQRKTLDALLRKLARRGDDGWMAVPLAASDASTVKTPFGKLTLWQEAHEHVQAVVHAIRKKTVKHLNQALGTTFDVQELQYLGARLDASGKPPADLPQAPGAALKALKQAALDVATRLKVVKTPGLTLHVEGPAAFLSGSVTVKNVGAKSSPLTTMSVAFWDPSRRDLPVGTVTVLVPNLKPDQAVSIPYGLTVSPNLQGRPVIAVGEIAADTVLARRPLQFVDSLLRFAKTDGGLASVGPQAAVPVLWWPEAVLAPSAVVASDAHVGFRLLVWKLGGPAAPIQDSTLILKLGNQLEPIAQAAPVLTGEGAGLVEVLFAPVNLRALLNVVFDDATAYPETLELGLLLRGPGFEYVHGPLYVRLSPDGTTDQPVAGTKLSITNPANPAKRTLVFKSKDAAFAMPDAVEAPTAVGATLQLFSMGGLGGATVAELPAKRWKQADGGFVYAGKGTVEDPCLEVVIAPGHFKANCRGAGLTIAPPFVDADDNTDMPVGVVVRIGDTRWCASFAPPFGANNIVEFSDSNSQAPSACPEPGE